MEVDLQATAVRHGDGVLLQRCRGGGDHPVGACGLGVAGYGKATLGLGRRCGLA